MVLSLCLHVQQSSITTFLVRRNELSSQLEISGKKRSPLSSLSILDENGVRYVFNFDVSGFEAILPNSTVLSSPEEFLYPPTVSLGKASDTKDVDRVPFFYLLKGIKEEYESYANCAIERAIVCCTPSFYYDSSLIVESIGKQCGFQSVTVISEFSLLCYAMPPQCSRFICFDATQSQAFFSSTSISRDSFASNYRDVDCLSFSSLSQQLHNSVFPTCTLSALESSLSQNSHTFARVIKDEQGGDCTIDEDVLTALIASHQAEILSSIEHLLSLHNWRQADLHGLIVPDISITPSMISLFHSLFPSIPVFVLSLDRDLDSAFLSFVDRATPRNKEDVRITAMNKNGKKSGYGEEFHSGHCVYRGLWENDLYNGIGVKYDLAGKVVYRGMFKNGEFSGHGEVLLEKGDRVVGVFSTGKLADGQYETHWENGRKCYSGCLKNGQRSGVGREFDLAGKVLFEGCFLENRRNGNGRLFLPDGSYIDGSFVDDALNGECTHFAADGTMIRRGRYNRGNEEGEWHVFDANGCVVYEGSFAEGQYFGKGVLYYPGGSIHYDGEFFRGEFNGFGQLYSPAGDLVYIGEFHSGERDGNGKEYDKSTRLVYTGSFKHDRRNGHGKQFFSSGHFYEGSFVDGEMEGKGKMVWSNGQWYEGEFHRGKKEGKGVYVWSDGSRYSGDYRDELRNGWGAQFDSRGRKVYEGNWVDDCPCGEGSIFYESGCVYTGNVKNQKREGQGTQCNAQGKIEYKGEWKNDLPHGFGTYYYGEGCFYEGSWVNGEKEGIGRMQYSNGNVYVGSFKNGVKSGKGCVLNSRGKILKEVFENKKTAE